MAADLNSAFSPPNASTTAASPISGVLKDEVEGMGS